MILLRQRVFSQKDFSNKVKSDVENYLPLYRTEDGRYRWRDESDPISTYEDEVRKKDAPKPDITTRGGDLILSKRAYKSFKKDLDKDKFRKEKIGKKTYYIGDLEINGDDIDQSKSTVKRFRDGRVMAVTDGVLKPGKSEKRIYRLPGGGYVADDDFVSKYNKKKLTGLTFEK